MEARQLVFTQEQPISLQIWRLLSRADAPALEDSGMRARAGYGGVTIKQLREEIDRDYFNLSEAYYQRHTVRL
jgi:DNA-binding transcriptional regulator YdaS (Cro superfamily)